MGKLAGKKAAVTGASSGIGRATALRLAQEGADLALLARNKQRLDQVAAQCRDLGVKAHVVRCDTTSRDQVNSAVAESLAVLGALDIFHCNAGIYLRRPACELQMEQIRKIMEVNFYGYLNCVYAILPHFLAKREGCIVATLSMDGKKGVPPDAAYAASKFALNGFFQVLRQELRDSGVHVATIFPSRMDTPQIAHVDCPGLTPKGDPRQVAEAVLKAIVHRRKEIVVPAHAKLLELADTLSPSLGDWMVRAIKAEGWENGQPALNEVDG